MRVGPIFLSAKWLTITVSAVIFSVAVAVVLRDRNSLLQGQVNSGCYFEQTNGSCGDNGTAVGNGCYANPGTPCTVNGQPGTCGGGSCMINSSSSSSSFVCQPQNCYAMYSQQQIGQSCGYYVACCPNGSGYTPWPVTCANNAGCVDGLCGSSFSSNSSVEVGPSISSSGGGNGAGGGVSGDSGGDIGGVGGGSSAGNPSSGGNPSSAGNQSSGGNVSSSGKLSSSGNPSSAGNQSSGGNVSSSGNQSSGGNKSSTGNSQNSSGAPNCSSTPKLPDAICANSVDFYMYGARQAAEFLKCQAEESGKNLQCSMCEYLSYFNAQPILKECIGECGTPLYDELYAGKTCVSAEQQKNCYDGCHVTEVYCMDHPPVGASIKDKKLYAAACAEQAISCFSKCPVYCPTCAGGSSQSARSSQSSGNSQSANSQSSNSSQHSGSSTSALYCCLPFINSCMLVSNAQVCTQAQGQPAGTTLQGCQQTCVNTQSSASNSTSSRSNSSTRTSCGSKSSTSSTSSKSSSRSSISSLDIQMRVNFTQAQYFDENGNPDPLRPVQPRVYFTEVTSSSASWTSRNTGDWLDVGRLGVVSPPATFHYDAPLLYPMKNDNAGPNNGLNQGVFVVFDPPTEIGKSFSDNHYAVYYGTIEFKGGYPITVYCKDEVHYPTGSWYACPEREHDGTWSVPDDDEIFIQNNVVYFYIHSKNVYNSDGRSDRVRIYLEGDSSSASSVASVGSAQSAAVDPCDDGNTDTSSHSSSKSGGSNGSNGSNNSNGSNGSNGSDGSNSSGGSSNSNSSQNSNGSNSSGSNGSNNSKSSNFSSKSNGSSKPNSSKKSSNSSIVGGICNGGECLHGGDGFCAAQSKVCALTADLPCLKCVTVAASSASNNSSASTKSTTSSVVINGSSSNRSNPFIPRSSSASTGNPPGTSCADDSQCSSGNCDAGTCRNPVPPGGSCTDDRQCSSGNCVNGICESPLPPSASCESNMQCASRSCVDGKCQNSIPLDALAFLGETCTADVQCVTKLCQNNLCTPCSQGLDCSSGLCRNGVCLQSGLTEGVYCVESSECQSGFCFQNVCVDPSTLPSTSTEQPVALVDPVTGKPLLSAPTEVLPATVIELPFFDDVNVEDGAQNGRDGQKVPGTYPSAPQTPSTGPAALAVMLAGGAAGWLYRRRK